jgi:hypothetical protein
LKITFIALVERAVLVPRVLLIRFSQVGIGNALLNWLKLWARRNKKYLLNCKQWLDLEVAEEDVGAEEVSEVAEEGVEAEEAGAAMEVEEEEEVDGKQNSPCE